MQVLLVQVEVFHADGLPQEPLIVTRHRLVRRFDCLRIETDHLLVLIDRFLQLSLPLLVERKVDSSLLLTRVEVSYSLLPMLASLLALGLKRDNMRLCELQVALMLQFALIVSKHWRAERWLLLRQIGQVDGTFLRTVISNLSHLGRALRILIIKYRFVGGVFLDEPACFLPLALLLCQ